MYTEKKLRDWDIADFLAWAAAGGAAVNGTTAQVIANRAIRDGHAEEGTVEEVVAFLKAKGAETSTEEAAADEGDSEVEAVEGQGQEEGTEVEETVGDELVEGADANSGHEIDDSEPSAELVEVEAAAPVVAEVSEARGMNSPVIHVDEAPFIETKEEAAPGPVFDAPVETQNQAPVKPALTSKEEREAKLTASMGTSVDQNAATGPGAVLPRPVSDTLATASTLKQFTKLETEVVARDVLNEYLAVMGKGRPLTEGKVVEMQIKFFNLLKNILSAKGSEFAKLWTLVLNVVNENRQNHFHELRNQRGFEALTHRLSQRDMMLFRRLMNLITTTCDPQSRGLSAKQVDFNVLQDGLSPEAHQLLMAYYHQA